MLKGRYILLAAFVGVVAAWLILPIRKPVYREPVYEGKCISRWFDDCAAQRKTDPLTAIQKIGPAGIPFAIRRIEADDSFWRRNYRRFWPKVPAVLRRTLPKPRPVLDDAVNIFINVGPPGIPQAIQALTNQNPKIRADAAMSFGRGATQVIPALITAMTDAYPTVRLCATCALGEWGQMHPTPCQP